MSAKDKILGDSKRNLKIARRTDRAGLFLIFCDLWVFWKLSNSPKSDQFCAKNCKQIAERIANEQLGYPQCEELIIFLPSRFYVKSNLY